MTASPTHVAVPVEPTDKFVNDVIAVLKRGSKFPVTDDERGHVRSSIQFALEQLAAAPQSPCDRDAVRDQLRRDGWRVAVHNDYRLNGEDYTFWLFTHPDGRWIKGEGKSDDEAISDAARSLKSKATP